MVPPFGVHPETKGFGDWWESPLKCQFHQVQVVRHWPARRSPGGGRSRGPAVVVGGEETLARGGSESLFCKKVKVSLYTFYFCFVNCCKTGQIYAVHRVKAAAEVAFDNEMQIN